MTDDEDDWEETESECEDDESVCGSETEWTECEEDEETMIAPLDVVRFGDVESRCLLGTPRETLRLD